MRWLVDVTSLGKSDKESLSVEADSWQKALQMARAERGEAASMNGFSIELLDDGCHAIDPVSRLRYDVKKAPEDPPAAPRSVPPRPSVAPVSASVSSSKRAPAWLRSTALGPGPGTEAVPAHPVPPRPASVPPPPPLAASTLAAPLAVSADVASSIPSQVLLKREQDATEAMPLSYREYAFVVPPGTTESAAETFLLTQVEIVRASLERVAPGKLVNLGVFDVVFEGKPPVPPLATLVWKDWRGAPVVSFPRRSTAPSPPLAPVFEPTPLPETAPEPAVASAEAPLPAAPVTEAPVTAAPPAPAPVAEPPHAHEPAPSHEAPQNQPAPPDPLLHERAPHESPSPLLPQPAAVAPMPVVNVVPAAIPPPALEPALAPAPPAEVLPSFPAAPAATFPPPDFATSPVALGTPPAVRLRVRGEDLIADLFEAMHDLHFVHDALEGGEFCLALAMEKLPSEAGLVHLYDIDRREFLVASTRGATASKLLLKRHPENDSMLMAAMRKRRALVVVDATQGDASTLARYVALGGARSVLVAPVIHHGRFLGAIELLNPLDGQPFNESEGNALTYIAEQFAEFISSHGIVTDPERIHQRRLPGT